MSITTVAVADLPAIIRDAVKRVSRKKKAMLASVYTPGSTHSIGWDGGSRDEFWVASRGGYVSPFHMPIDPNRNADPYNHRRVFPPVADLPIGTVGIIRAGTSCGKPAMPLVWMVERVTNADKVADAAGAPGDVPAGYDRSDFNA